MSFIKVDINTNPIPEGVLEPKPFGYPSGGGGGGGGPVNFTLGDGSGTFGDISITVPPVTNDFTLLEVPKAYIGGKFGWGFLTIKTIFAPNNPYPNLNARMGGTAQLKVLPAPGFLYDPFLEAATIFVGKTGLVLQTHFLTPIGNMTAKISCDNNLKWQLLNEANEVIAEQNAELRFQGLVYTILEV